MEHVNCPKCGKELIRLEPYETGIYEFWCDYCNLDIVVTDNDVIEQIQTESWED